MPSLSTLSLISPEQLDIWLEDDTELAVLDIRDLGPYSRGHLWCAVHLPYSRIEVSINRFVPRKTTRILLCDDRQELVSRAVKALTGMGYTNIHALQGGLSAWQAENRPLANGNYCLAHAFGYYIADQYNTPTITASDLKQRLDEGDNILLVDSRPTEAFRQGSLPGSVNIPVAELPYKIQDYISGPETRIIVHCAGITRGILGGQSLLQTGVLPNPVSVLLHGTKGWLEAGYALLDNQPQTEASTKEARNIEYTPADPIPTATLDTLRYWQSHEEDRTTYLIDIRPPEAYRKGHLPGALSIPGGELAGMTSDHIATRGARLCLIGEKRTGNAEITAFWMLHLGWDVVILQDWQTITSLETGPEPSTDLAPLSLPRLSPEAVHSLIQTGTLCILDVSSSQDHETGHIEGAYWILRSQLPHRISKLPVTDGYLITSRSGHTAAFAAGELQTLTDKPVSILEGGTDAWISAGYSLTRGIVNPLCTPDDIDTIMTAPQADPARTPRHHLTAYNIWRRGLYDRYRSQSFRPFTCPKPQNHT